MTLRSGMPEISMHPSSAKSIATRVGAVHTGPPPLVLPFVTKYAALPNALHMREVVRAAPDLVALLQ